MEEIDEIEVSNTLKKYKEKNLKHLLLIPCIVFIILILKDLTQTPLVRDWLYFILLEFFLQVYYNRIVKEDL